MLTSDIKFAVGIDFGHGETSFSYYNITWGKDIAGQKATEKTVISLQDGTKTIPSIYLYNKDTDYMFIGKTAGINYGQIIGDRSNYVYGVSFKKPITRMSEEEKKLFKRYMMEVKKVLMCCSPVGLKDEDLENQVKRNYVVVIAKPSGWSKSEDNMYLNLAKEAGLPVIGISELTGFPEELLSCDSSQKMTQHQRLTERTYPSMTSKRFMKVAC